jgi:peroxiredoxin
MICKIELGELESHYQEFDKRHVRVVAISNDDQNDSQAMQADIPHLVVVSDAEQNIAKAIDVIHRGAMAPGGKETNAPTTFLVDGTGNVRWFFRPDSYLARIPPDDLLAAIDKNLPPDQHK